MLRTGAPSAIRPRTALAVVLSVAAVTVLTAGPGLFAQGSARRVVAVADVHGAYDSFLQILRETSLVDETGRWAGGDAVFVQTGDVTDRGADVRKVLDLLRALEAEAPEQGGRVVALLGNHETMNMTRFLRDVSSRVYPGFVDDRSASRRRDAYRQYVRLVDRRRQVLGGEPFTVLDEETWMAAHPAGLLEYIDAFGPKGEYGRWLRAKDAIARIDGTVYLHGGLNPDTAVSSLDDMNARVRNELTRFDAYSAELVERGVILPFFTFDETLEAAKVDLDAWTARLQPDAPEPAVLTGADREYLRGVIDLLQAGAWSVFSPDGPLWFRGYAQWTDAYGGEAIGALLDRLEADRVVVGHTPTAVGRIVTRFEHRVFLIDTGMLAEAYNGRASALEIADGQVTAIYEDGRLLLTPAAAGAVR